VATQNIILSYTLGAVISVWSFWFESLIRSLYIGPIHSAALMSTLLYAVVDIWVRIVLRINCSVVGGFA